MKKWIIVAICVASALFLLLTSVTSHDGVTYTSIGTTYNEFLFFPEKSARFTISFKSPYSGVLTLIDDKGKVLADSKYTIEIDGKKGGPSFIVKEKKAVHVAIRCKKSVSRGKQYVQVEGGGPLVTHVYFKHHLNPLFVWLSWIVMALAVVSLLWFIVLRKVFYPQFKSCRKTLIIPNQTPLQIKMTGARMVVISSAYRKQSFWDALIKGPIVYKVHPEFTSQIIMFPVRGRILVKADSAVYRVSPNPMDRVGAAVIENVTSGMRISIN